MSLREYHKKRDFSRSPEPRGAAGRSESGRLFIVQKHAASRTHYDLRLELDGVLVSWAVPKGPCLDPREKRLAVHVEDHPIEYGDFEGVIPDGYGAGTVMLWDRGEWFPLEDPKERKQLTPQEGMREGRLKVELRGQKLRGGFMLVRVKNPTDRADNWLLIKERDTGQRRLDEYDVLDDSPFSVVTNRTLREIADDKDNLWTTGGAKGRRASGWLRRRPAAPLSCPLEIETLDGVRRLASAPKIKPPAARPAKSAPDGDEWLHEIAPEGRRLIVRLEPRQIALVDEAGMDWAPRTPHVSLALAALPFEQALLDGVLTAPDEQGLTREATLNDALEAGEFERLEFHALDLMYADGFDLRQTPLEQRKALLSKSIDAAAEHASGLRFVEHIRGQGPTVMAQACRLGVGGLLSRRADSPYPARKGNDWTLAACANASGDDAARDTTKPAERKAPTASAKRVAVSPRVEIQGVRLTNPERVLYPDERVTKRDLARYYEAVSERMLPHITRRPLSLFRCPGGIEKPGFFQKHLHDYQSPFLRESSVREEDGKDPYIALDDVRGLLTLAQLSVLEIHPWGCREDDIEKPDRVIFDLDPGPEVTWSHVVEGALAVREVLRALGLRSFVKTSGGKGLHVVVPIQRRCSWDDAKTFAERVAKHIVRLAAHRYTATMTKSRRPGKVFIDYFRNHRGSTCVAPYSTRARPGAMISAPIEWDELESKESGAKARVHDIRSFLSSLAEPRPDPWADFFAVRQSITRAMVSRLATP